MRESIQCTTTGPCLLVVVQLGLLKGLDSTACPIALSGTILEKLEVIKSSNAVTKCR